MPIIEVQSLEDIDLALKEAELMPIKPQVENVESMTPNVEINSLIMPVINA